MNKKQKKRKIKIAITLEGRHIKKKYRVGKFVQVLPKNKKRKQEKFQKVQKMDVSCFALVVVKIPWYKRAWRTIFGF
ncbi:MAG: hypothetical protein HFJ52_08995 [Clostridia bacterium]|nr:hypothetical protein [Clostridia bacterium]